MFLEEPKMNQIVWLNKVGKNDVSIVGGKAANLGELIKLGVNVPLGFTITSLAYKEFLEKNRLKKQVNDFYKQKKKNFNKIQKEIIESDIPKELEHKIVENFSKIKGNVAVRSSATIEDSKNASFAGQFSTFLNVNTKDNLIKAVKKCYASQFNQRNVSYMKKVKASFPLIAVVIQKMVQPKKAGVIFTVNPVTNENNIVVESVKGIGEALVSGEVTPNSYVLEKKEFKIQNKAFSGNGRLTNKELKDLWLVAKNIEAFFGSPQDIEWAIADKLYIVQARPVTTLGTKTSKKWMKILSREYGVQYTEVSLRCLTSEVKDLVPYSFHDQIYLPEHGNEVCYIKEEKWKNLVKSLESKWNEKNADKFEKIFVKTGNQLVSFTEKLSKLDLEKKNNPKLKKLYLKYRKLNIRYTSFIWTAFILNDSFAQKAEEILNKNFRGKKRHEYHESVFSPEKKSSILELTYLVSKNKNNSDKYLSELYGKFNWIPCLDIHKAPWTKKEFLDYLRQIKKRKIEQANVISKLPIKTTEKNALNVAKKFAYLKDLRDDFRRKSVYLARNSILGEIALRMGISLEDFSYLQEKEVLIFLDKGIVPQNIEQRKKGFGIFFDNDKNIKCLYGKDALKLAQKYGVDFKYKKTKSSNGLIASIGVAKGIVKIVRGIKDLSKIRKNDIMVAVTTHPDYVPAMEKCSAIVTDEGGITCHAAIVSRELKVPCIVGTKNSTKIFKDNDVVQIDATNGTIKLLKKALVK